MNNAYGSGEPKPFDADDVLRAFQRAVRKVRLEDLRLAKEEARSKSKAADSAPSHTESNESKPRPFDPEDVLRAFRRGVRKALAENKNHAKKTGRSKAA